MKVPGQEELLILDFPTAREDREFQPDLFQQNIIDEENQARNEEVIDMTHRYNLCQIKSNWRDRYADHYATLIILTNMTIPKAIIMYGTSVVKEVHDKGMWTPVTCENISNKAKIIRSLIF